MIKSPAFLEAYLPYLLGGSLLCVALFHWYFPEFIQEENGLGWDGEAYASILKNFKEQIQTRQINSYYFQRILPIALVHSFFYITDFPLSDTNIIQAFLALNILLISISFFVWVLLCKHLQLGLQGKVLSFTGIFLNYALLKMPFYYPILTDLIAFTIGLLMFYCFLRNYTVVLFLISIIGAFSFPTLFYCGMLLYVLPVQDQLKGAHKTYSFLNKWIAGLGILVFIVVFVIAFFIKDKPYINPPGRLLFAISFILALSYVYITIYKLIRLDWYIQELANIQTWKRIGIALVSFISITLFTKWVSSPEDPILNYKGFLANVVMEAISNPLAFLVAHFVYFGPVFLLLLYFRKEFVHQMNRYGVGLHGFIVLYLLMGAGSESRQFINAWPVFVLVLCVALEKYKFSTLSLLVLVATSLIISKFWYRINIEIFEGDFLNFPYQRYFMSQGPWMSDAMYLLQGSIALLTYGVVYFLFLRQRNYKQLDHTQTNHQ